MKTCVKCGAQNDDGESVCLECGASLGQYAPPQPQQNQYAPQQPEGQYAPQQQPQGQYAPQQPQQNQYAPQQNQYAPQPQQNQYAPQQNQYAPQQPQGQYAPPQPQQNQYAPQQPQQGGYAPQQQGYAAQGAYAAPAYAPKPQPILSQNPYINLVKNGGMSMLFIVSAGIYSLYALFSLIGTFINIANINSAFGSVFGQTFGMMSDFGIPGLSNVEGMFAGVQAFIVIFLILLLLPTLMVCAGLWLFRFVSCKPDDGGPASTTGLTMIQAMAVTVIVVTCLLVGLMLVVVIMGLIGVGTVSSYDYYGYAQGATGAATGGLILVLFLTLIAGAIAFMYQMAIVKTIGTLKRTLTTGAPCEKISLFVAIMNIIIAVFSLIGLIMSLSNPFGVNVLGIFQSLVSMTFLVLISVCMFSFQKQATDLNFRQGGGQPQYGAPAYGAQQYTPPQNPNQPRY